MKKKMIWTALLVVLCLLLSGCRTRNLLSSPAMPEDSGKEASGLSESAAGSLPEEDPDAGSSPDEQEKTGISATGQRKTPKLPEKNMMRTGPRRSCPERSGPFMKTVKASVFPLPGKARAGVRQN